MSTDAPRVVLHPTDSLRPDPVCGASPLVELPLLVMAMMRKAWTNAVVFFRVLYVVAAYDGREFDRRCRALADYIESHTTKEQP